MVSCVGVAEATQNVGWALLLVGESERARLHLDRDDVAALANVGEVDSHSRVGLDVADLARLSRTVHRDDLQ